MLIPFVSSVLSLVKTIAEICACLGITLACLKYTGLYKG